MATEEQKRNNRRTGLILASIAAAFFVGVMVKMVLLAQ